MFEGSVRAIFIAADEGGAMESVDVIDAVEGLGLAGDRYAGPIEHTEPGQDVTLIELEAIEAAQREYGVDLGLSGSRRNVVTVGVPLNHLVGHTFAVGHVVLRGMELCEPCGSLQKVTGQPVAKAFRHRGGLRADIITGGTFRVGDAVRALS